MNIPTYNLNHFFKSPWNANNNNFVIIIRNSIRCNHNNHRQDHSHLIMFFYTRGVYVYDETMKIYIFSFV